MSLNCFSSVLRVVVLMVASGFAAPHALAIGPDPQRDWRSAETAHFRFHFEARHRAQAHRVAELAEQIHPRVTRRLNWAPREKTEVVLSDYIDQANGMATPMPYNTIYLFMVPPAEGELLQNGEWMSLVFTHEYIHIVHLDKAVGSPLGLRSVLGRLPFLFPNIFQPNWLVEGLATYGESAPSKKVGRLKNSAFEAQMRVEAERGFLSLREINAGGRALPRNRAYLYGAYFYDFIAARYGEKAVTALVASYSDNLLPFRVHSNPEDATGKTMDDLWEEFIAHLKVRFAAPSGDQAVPDGRFVLSAPEVGAVAQGNGGSLYVVRYDGLTDAELVQRRPDSETRVLATVARNAQLDVSSRGEVLVVQPDVIDEHDFFNDLYVWREGRFAALERLTVGGRWREVVWLRDAGAQGGGFAALRYEGDGTVALWRLDSAGVPKEQLYRAAPDELLVGLAAREGRLAFASLQDKVWRLLEWSPDGVRTLLSDSAIKHSLHYAADGGALLFVADYDNTPGLWRLSLGDGMPTSGMPTLARLTSSRTAITGISAPGSAGTYFRLLVPEGEEVRVLVEPVSLQATKDVPPSDASPVAVETSQPPRPVFSGLSADLAYQPWTSLMPRSWFPAFQLADGVFIVGAQIFGSDVLGNHQYAAIPLVEIKQNEVLGQLAYLYDERFFVSAERELIVNLTKGDREKELVAYTIAESWQALALAPYTRRTWRVFAGAGLAFERSTYKVVDGLRWRGQDERIGGVVMGFDSRRVHWLSEGPSQGVALTVIAEKGLAGSDYPGAVWHVEGRANLPVGRTVLAARGRFGQAQVDAENFYIGGIEQRFLYALPDLNQRVFGLRGYDGGVQRGTRMQLGSIEWRVPLADIDRHLMLPPIGINRLSAAFFAEAGRAWTPNRGGDVLRSRGVELLGEMKLGYLMPLGLRFGYVEALDGIKDKRTYLTLGRAF